MYTWCRATFTAGAATVAPIRTMAFAVRVTLDVKHMSLMTSPLDACMTVPVVALVEMQSLDQFEPLSVKFCGSWLSVVTPHEPLIVSAWIPEAMSVLSALVSLPVQL